MIRLLACLLALGGGLPVVVWCWVLVSSVLSLGCSGGLGRVVIVPRGTIWFRKKIFPCQLNDKGF